MSLTVKFYNNGSSINTADKTLTEHTLYSGSYLLKDDTSIQTPTLICKITTGQLQNDTNYFYIEDFQRYYFITDITAIKGGLFEISGRCDVLTTAWKNMGLKNCRGIVNRTENSSINNFYLDDGFFRVENRPKVQTKVFPNSFNSYNFVLLMAGQ